MVEIPQRSQLHRSLSRMGFEQLPLNCLENATFFHILLSEVKIQLQNAYPVQFNPFALYKSN